ncbi:MAG: GntR family transcriptional regulator, partial [Mesorhizobium sp.]|nr:GntR family transcriptional regulator [Mesorhizobium sp.]
MVIKHDPVPESATQRAYRALERMIVTLDLRPGGVTTEGALIERIGLGRTPVREAIQRLAWEGLLEVRARAGLAIAPLHPGDWLKVIDARRGVEIILAQSAARHVTRETAQRFHDSALAMQKAVIAGNVV